MIVFCNKQNSFDTVNKSRQTLLQMCHLGGDFLCKADENYLSKFMNACFNCHPPVKRKSHNKTWDINLVLDYLTNLGDNSELSHNVLAGKCILLILLSTMCRRDEVMQLKLLGLTQNDKFQILFTLNIPIKNFNRQTSRETELQKITLLPFHSHKLLCPVCTLKAYLLKTALVCKKVDQIFILFEDPPRPASPATVSRWCKNLLQLAGVKTYSVHSTRASASSNAILSGIPLDTVVSLAGWVNTSTFTHYYMKDLEKFVQNTDPNCSMFVKL